ncbi:unnamed protein product [Trichogramma brassicae]|uniref:Reverse transcriptase domain-containing protein n=1 Tax=Trichogramma brassicae TaxID=86971 RepID=A0A6H5IG41_9HYME|nr:unnamed protein product [Trichogramma brassicae]
MTRQRTSSDNWLEHLVVWGLDEEDLVEHDRTEHRQTTTQDRSERIRYQRLKRIRRKSMRKAASLILDGETRAARMPSLETQLAFWEPVMSPPEEPVNEAHHRAAEAVPSRHLWHLWDPISAAEVRMLRPKRDTAAGPDGVDPDGWGRIPDVEKALAFNCILRLGRCPDAILNSRTILIPKIDGNGSSIVQALINTVHHPEALPQNPG